MAEYSNADRIVVFSNPSICDWSVLPGQIAFNQIKFCNLVGGKDFSTSFSDMIESLKTDYTPQKVFLNCKNYNSIPTTEPSNSATPEAWTKVSDNSGNQRWERLWDIDNPPPPNLIPSYNGNPSTQRELIFKPKGSTSPIGTMTIHAKAVIEVSILPSKWYSESILSRASQNGGSLFYNKGDFETYFGTNGLLTYVNTSFIVALMPYQDVIYVQFGDDPGSKTLPAIGLSNEYKFYILALMQKKTVK